MDRKTGRALAKTTLEDLELFGSVTAYEPGELTGSAFAVIHSKSLAMLQDARGDFDGPAEIWVTIYLRRASGHGADAEDALDDLVRACMRALWSAFYGEAANLQIGPSQAGVPLDPIDGKNYRMERFSVRFNDDSED
jgi:hypothetical protein